MSETTIQQNIMLAVSKLGARIFRNNVGVAKFKEKGSDEPRYVRYGLCVGSSDLIGWLPITVTPDMVGKRVAVFLAVEVKTAKGPEAEKQATFRAAVTAAGGIAGVARSDEQAIELVTNRAPLGFAIDRKRA